jgi:predicted lysophospholipase L1 biosynthesis ABC-type transport system permease subunit
VLVRSNSNNEKNGSMLGYSVKLTVSACFALIVLIALIAVFGNNNLIGWVFLGVWVILAFFILRGIYLKWFR